MKIDDQITYEEEKETTKTILLIYIYDIIYYITDHMKTRTRLQIFSPRLYLKYFLQDYFCRVSIYDCFTITEGLHFYFCQNKNKNIIFAESPFMTMLWPSPKVTLSSNKNKTKTLKDINPRSEIEVESIYHRKKYQEHVSVWAQQFLESFQILFRVIELHYLWMIPPM